jgi:hypothetical protein
MTNKGNKYLLQEVKDQKAKMDALTIQNNRLIAKNCTLETQLLKFKGPLLQCIRELLKFRKQ